MDMNFSLPLAAFSTSWPLRASAISPISFSSHVAASYSPSFSTRFPNLWSHLFTASRHDRPPSSAFPAIHHVLSRRLAGTSPEYRLLRAQQRLWFPETRFSRLPHLNLWIRFSPLWYIRLLSHGRRHHHSVFHLYIIIMSDWFAYTCTVDQQRKVREVHFLI